MSAEEFLDMEESAADKVKEEVLFEDEEKAYEWNKYEVGLLYGSLKELEQKVSRCWETQELVHQLLGKVNELERRLSSETAEDIKFVENGSVQEEPDLPDPLSPAPDPPSPKPDPVSPVSVPSSPSPSSTPPPRAKSSKKPERCQICSRVYTSSWHLNRHMIEVHMAGTFLECSVCKRSFRGQYRLRKHQKCQHEGVPTPDQPTEAIPTYNCSTCSTQFETKNDLNNHVVSEHSEFKCQLCTSDSTYSAEEMAEHFKSQHSKPVQGSARLRSSCPVCSKVLARSWHLARHMSSVHSIGKPLECSVCEKLFHGKKKLILHQKREHEKLRVVSNGPNDVKPSTERTRRYTPRKKLATDDTSRASDLTEDDSEEMAEYYTTEHPKPADEQVIKTTTCPVCSKVLTRSWQLDRHNMSSVHSIGKPLKCSDCKKLFHGKVKLTLHRKREHGEVPEDGTTSAEGLSRSGLRKKAATDTDTNETSVEVEEEGTIDHSAVTEPFKCKLCDSESVYNAEEMAEHFATEHPKPAHGQGRKTTFCCPVCGKVCPRPWHLARHMLSLHGIGKPLECTICKQTFKGRGKLRGHQKRTHGGVPKRLIVAKENEFHNCSDCQKPFPNKATLKKHLPACRGLRPFQCDECGQAFSYQGSLKEHTDRIHKQIRRCLCPHCGKRFYGTGNFKRHLLTHRGIKRSGRSANLNDASEADSD